MEKKVDVLIIGGGPAAIVTAVTVRKYYPDKEIQVVKDIEKGVIPCGIPYMFASLKDPEENELGSAPFEKNNVDVAIAKAVKIDRDKKTVEMEDSGSYRYEKLVLAVGSTPVVPPIPGIDRRGVYHIYKDMEYLKKCVEEVKKLKNILIIGGGFIGVEFADELSKIDGLNVYLVEVLPRLLANSFDPEFSGLVETKLRSKGVNVLTGTCVKEFTGGERVEKVILSDGGEIDVDGVMLGIGAVPNIKLASDASLDQGRGKGIWVDEYMRTSDPDIFAVGDCAGKRDFYTRKDAAVMLASTA
ncbi:MAG: FAD-dependent oxidoreductase, partial [Candidatus Omnitrophica bacterium]|nr:FAD-dependent oxidoreductase [Candidatus Omnitrophota bacterium]